VAPLRPAVTFPAGGALVAARRQAVAEGAARPELGELSSIFLPRLKARNARPRELHATELD
jgi:hypothetical protein